MRLVKGKRSMQVSITQAQGVRILRGLMCTRSSHTPLYFKLRFPFSIHSFFVFYPFFAVWIGKRNRILRTDLVSPFTFHISPPDGTTGLLEIPVHTKYTSQGTFLVGKKQFFALLSSRRTNI
ncbi:hypothetical protein FJZ22_03115 [Candidatus Pacearchaeota archaeon]|nr:hypothetical protein [Candidatus Pacearchaeota archaeon]